MRRLFRVEERIAMELAIVTVGVADWTTHDISYVTASTR